MLRAFDILLSSLAILCLLPLMLPVMLLLRLTGEHKVFYLQERVGKDGEPFRVFKFATMLEASPHLPGGYLTRKNDPRVLPVGRVLRKWKVNEFPQLLNVWLGDMSFVGPRPQAKVHHELYSREQRTAIERQRPGITGIAALVFRDEEEVLERLGGDADRQHDHVITPYKGALETWYAEHGSAGLYWRILFLTAVSLIRPEENFLRFFPDAPRPGPELGAALRGERVREGEDPSAPASRAGSAERSTRPVHP